MIISSKEINLIQQVHNHVHNLNIDLPSITVVGPQSSGKSSVLESLIERDILPRGTSLVTRCPIIIHLKKTNEDEFLELNNLKYSLTRDTKLIKDKILKSMDQICGTDKEICSDPIFLNLYLKDTLEFTLIDLPGITKVAIGKQSDDIETKILKMIREYIIPKNTILLAVINSNVDISNSEALKICKEVDPDFSRTLGVVTKIDLMDQGTNCLDILKNKIYPLRLGFVGVINRSQKDLKLNISIQDFKIKEAEFFKDGVYKKLENTGSTFLKNKVSGLYHNKVKEIFPKIKEDLRFKLKEIQDGRYVDSFILKYKYHLTLKKLIEDTKISDLFTYDDTNIITNLNTFRSLKVTYDFSNIKDLILTDLSIFINDNIIILIIKNNMKLIKKNILSLQSKFNDILKNKILNIKSKLFPNVCATFNNVLLSEISKWNLEDKIGEYVDICSNVIGNTDLFFKNAVTTNLFGTHMCLKGGSKEEILREFSKVYLDKQIINIVEYTLKLNYFMINKFIESTSMEILSRINVEEMDEIVEYMREMVKKNEDAKNILEAIKILS